MAVLFPLSGPLPEQDQLGEVDRHPLVLLLDVPPAPGLVRVVLLTVGTGLHVALVLQHLVHLGAS